MFTVASNASTASLCGTRTLRTSNQNKNFFSRTGAEHVPIFKVSGPVFLAQQKVL